MLQSAAGLLKLQTLVPEHCLCNSQTLPARLSKPRRLALRRETEKNASRDEQQQRRKAAAEQQDEQQRRVVCKKILCKPRLVSVAFLLLQTQSPSSQLLYSHSRNKSRSIPIDNEKLNGPKRVSKGMKYTYEIYSNRYN